MPDFGKHYLFTKQNGGYDISFHKLLEESFLIDIFKTNFHCERYISFLRKHADIILYIDGTIRANYFLHI